MLRICGDSGGQAGGQRRAPQGAAGGSHSQARRMRWAYTHRLREWSFRLAYARGGAAPAANGPSRLGLQRVFACVCSWPLLCLCAEVPRGGGVLYVSVSRRFTVPPPVLQRSAALRTSPARLVLAARPPATTPHCIAGVDRMVLGRLAIFRREAELRCGRCPWTGRIQRLLAKISVRSACGCRGESRCFFCCAAASVHSVKHGTRTMGNGDVAGRMCVT
jgi:hypothetical protein